MKRLIIFIMMLLIFLASIGIGYFYLNTREDQKKESKSNEILIENNNQNETKEAENSEEKVSPNSEITTTILYKKCGHEIIETKTVDKDIINLNKEELAEKYEGYIIETFSNGQISLYKEEEKMCGEHFYIGESDGLICVYKLNEDGEEELYDSTNITLEYLPTEEKEKVKEKIEVIGKEDLYKILENFES